ncbi:MAG: amidase [Pseudomonadota bacterium]
MKLTITRRELLKSGVAAGIVVLAPGGSGDHASAQPRKTGPIDELLDQDTLDLAEMIRGKQISRIELLDVIINRIEASNPTLNFMTTRAYDRARERAQLISDDAPFAGVPFLMKDMVDVGGMLRTDGSKLLEKNVPDKNVLYVDAVEEAGLNIIGMTNVPELASYIMTDNSLYGPTLNPWNLEYSAYTSSGGAAAAVAAGVMSMVHGTDGAGSNRLPPSATGIFGMKPSRGRKLSGEADGGHDLAKTNQAISRTVRENAALFDLTEDKSGGAFKPVGFVQGPSERRLKIGYVANPRTNVPVEPEVLAAQMSTANLLENLGHEVIEVEFPVDEQQMQENYFAFFAGKVGGLKALVEQVSGKPVLESGLLTRLLASNVEYSVDNYTPADIEAGIAYLKSLSEVFANVFAEIDIMLAPISPVVCPKLDEASYDDLWSDEVANFMMGRLRFTAPINPAGIPAMSVPLNWGATSGMPIGSHFIAGAGNEKTLFELAYELEEARPWRTRWAPFSLKFVERFASPPDHEPVSTPVNPDEDNIPEGFKPPDLL